MVTRKAASGRRSAGMGMIGFDPPSRIVGASLPEWKSNLHLSHSLA